MIEYNRLNDWNYVCQLAHVVQPDEDDIISLIRQMLRYFKYGDTGYGKFPARPNKANNWWPVQQHMSRQLYILNCWYGRGLIPYELGMTFRTASQHKPDHYDE
jgi:hypothetical protein